MDKKRIEVIKQQYDLVIQNYDGENIEFWFARDLMALLGYDRWENFDKAISTAITMILKDGTVKECKVFNEKYPYSSDFYMGDSWTKESSILPHEFYNTAIGDIAYIKLTNVGVWTYVQYHREIISTSYEIEIYNAE